DSSTPGVPSIFILDFLNSTTRFLQGYYAERDGDWIFSYLLSPQPGLALVRDNSTPDVGVNDCECATSYQDYSSRTHLMAPAELAPRGGDWVSNFTVPVDAGVDWFIYAKVV
ncbi:MAG: hypothetical protein L0H83_01340, partial [Salinisphaera sp.]|nr:hypothetical protein [Salinisphaera sp.]